MKHKNKLGERTMAIVRDWIFEGARRGVLGLHSMRRCRAAGTLRDEDGTSLIEFAMVLPLLMSLLTGAASFSMALYSYQQLGYAASNAAQQLAAQAGLKVTDPCANVVSTVTAALSTWTASKLTYTVSITDSSGTAHTYGPTAGSSFSCTAGSAYLTANEPATVQVSYQYSWFPILAFSPSSSLTSSESALME